jgi:hypothetical protein
MRQQAMFYGQQVQDTRMLFFVSWKKYRNAEPLHAIEKQIVAVILDHPEYHALLASEHHEDVYLPELGVSNPFLHMGLHLAIRDQVALDKPPGIAAIYKQLIAQQDVLSVEHAMMECLAECLWKAQRNQQAPDEVSYLDACQVLVP